MNLQQMLIDSYDVSDRMRGDAVEERRHMCQQATVLSPESHEVNGMGSESVGRTNSSTTASPRTLSQGGHERSNDTIGEGQGNYRLPYYNSDDYEFGEMEWEEVDNEHDEALQDLEEAAVTPLYAESKLSSMDATYMILNQTKLHGWSNVSVDEHLRLLSIVWLSKPNSLPRSYREAVEYLKQLGHSYNSYDACLNHCCLFKDNLKDEEFCPKCWAPRRIRAGRSMVPQKVCRYFPIIPRFRRMFHSPLQALAMVWWALNKSDGDIVTHVSHSKQWEYIDNVFKEIFAEEDRNACLAVCTNGMNPTSDKRSIHSLWPVLLLNYNIALWLTTKKYFIMLVILIPGSKSITGDHIDIYLNPLIDELVLLWDEGIRC